jgi:N6-adenosine-specific RNA methylase IME4
MASIELVEDDGLAALAEVVRTEYAASREALSDAVEHYFRCGAALLEARKLLPSDQAFGAWREAQNFGFSQQWAHILRQGAEYEGAVRKAVTTQVVTGAGALNFKKAVKQAVAALGGGRAARPALPALHSVDPDVAVYPTIVIDPPWQYGNKATRNAAEFHYPTMSYDELAELELPAADNAHLYLWVTNNFMREGLDLCDLWGFEYKTLLTWVKPQMGMGNYFRSVTEHVIFGTKGSLPTARRDRTNVINADRTRHSAKPDAFYDLVEQMSPGPYYEMFARSRRMGDWHLWGNEA